MTARKYIFDLITQDTILNALGITADSTFTTNTVDTPQIRPLCILNWQPTNPGMQNTQKSSGLKGWPINQRILQVWVHDSDKAGDYGIIDLALKRLRAILMAVEGVNVGEPGAWLSGINWEGDSGDLRDDEQRTITRNAQFRLTGSAI